jgi:hypothetical protein
LGETNFVGKRKTRAIPKNIKNKREQFSMNLEVKPLNTKNPENSKLKNATNFSYEISFR